MKNKLILTITYLLTAILLIFGPHTIFKVCEVMEKPMKCYYSIKAVLGISIILIVSAILYFFTKTLRERILVSTIAIVSGIVTFIIPSVLIGGCSMKTMACQAVTFPAIYIISALIIILSLVNIFWLTINATRNLVNINEEKSDYQAYCIK